MEPKAQSGVQGRRNKTKHPSVPPFIADGTAQPCAVADKLVHLQWHAISEAILQLLVASLVFMCGHRRYNRKTYSWKITK